MKFFLYCILGLFSTAVTCQQKFSKEFSFMNDNDLYASFNKDQYYTNGIFLSYKVTAKNQGKDYKKIREYTLGQEIYTPFRPDVRSILRHDRPFAGYLYGSYGTIRAYKNQSIFKNIIQVGIVGKDALGEELQNLIHDTYNFDMPEGWEYQIENTFALNLDFEYFKPLGIDKTELNDINLYSKVRLGTIFNEISSGLMGRIGLTKLQPNDNSIAFGTHLNNENTSFVRAIESFFYYQTTLTYVIYDATMQGGLFSDNSPVTKNPNSIRFNLEFGYRFTARKWHFGYAYHFHSNKAPDLRNDKGNVYGRFFFSYLFN